MPNSLNAASTATGTHTDLADQFAIISATLTKNIIRIKADHSLGHSGKIGFDLNVEMVLVPVDLPSVGRSRLPSLLP